MKAEEKVYIDVARCKGCGYCIHACPKQAVTVSDYINENGYNVIQINLLQGMPGLCL